MSSEVVIRPPRPDEVDAAAALLNEHSRRLHGTDDTTPAELRNYWDAPDVDSERDVMLAASADGALTGYADLGAYGDAVWFDIRGFELEPLRALLDATEARADEKKPGAILRGWANEQDGAVRKLYEEAGYRLIRHSFRMEIDLAGTLAKPAWPEAIAVRTFREGDEERVYEAQMASFADTWAFSREPFEEWAHWSLKHPGFDPQLWFLAEAGDELAGIALNRASETELGLGWVNILGVVPAHRRRGLAQALLQNTFREFARRGFERVGLGVDAENPTGAVRLYERAGMHVARTSVQYEKA